MATIAKIFKNKSGFMLALLLMFFIGTAAVMARTLTDDKKENSPTEKKKKGVVTKKHKKQDDTVWYFTGTSAQIKNADYWRNTGSTPADCQGTGTRPCSISVVASDEDGLQDYLDDYTANQITAQSAQKRP